jgi:hypothetical protein
MSSLAMVRSVPRPSLRPPFERWVFAFLLSLQDCESGRSSVLTSTREFSSGPRVDACSRSARSLENGSLVVKQDLGHASDIQP